MKRLFIAAGFLALMGRLVAAPASEAIAHAVLHADRLRMEAMMAGDGAALGRVLSDEVVFVHSDARVELKADYVRNLTAGDTAYADVKTAQVQVLQPAADVVVLIGAQTMRKKLGPTWSDIALRFLSVWRKEGDLWRMVAWQSARPSGNSAVPPKP